MSPAPDAVRITLRPIGNPLPLGFLALSAGTILVSGLQLGWLAPAQSADVALILIAFVAPLQLVTSVFGYLGRDAVVGTGMGLLSGTWLSIGLVLHTAPHPGATSDALGLFLLVAGVAMLVPASAATAGKLVPFAVLATTAARFLATGIYEIHPGPASKDVAGVIGLILGGLAIYAALALALEDAHKRTILPLGRRGPGARALDGSLADEVRSVHHEAGVRNQL